MTDAIEAFLEPLLGTLDLIMLVQRHLHPPMAPRLAEALAPRAELVAAPLAALEGAQWPDDLQFMRDRLLDVGRQTVALVNASSTPRARRTIPSASTARCAASRCGIGSWGGRRPSLGAYVTGPGSEYKAARSAVEEVDVRSVDDAYLLHRFLQIG